MRTVVAALALIAAACAPGAPDDSRYVAEIMSAREAKDAELGSAAGSPILPADRGRFLPLSYFPPDPRFAVPAVFEQDPAANRIRVEMQTSANKPRLMERLGTLRFTLEGRQLQLTAFVEAGQRPDRLFVPFMDETSGKATYIAGRYLEILPETTGIYVVDFNRAYNPFCYYNAAYDCPFPPRENRLPVAITAGERVREE
ncbi:MAG TPA: DUF1684 domain-containing protein [Vicinamibacterales bacterium]|nr:DUF1684 domain-containing protein [Vicinamibacterales bacterium]